MLVLDLLSGHWETDIISTQENLFEMILNLLLSNLVELTGR